METAVGWDRTETSLHLHNTDLCALEPAKVSADWVAGVRSELFEEQSAPFRSQGLQRTGEAVQMAGIDPGCYGWPCEAGINIEGLGRLTVNVNI